MVAPLQQQLWRQEESLRATSESLASLEARVGSRDAKLGALEEALSEQPAMLAAAVEAAAGPLQQQLAALEAQQAKDGETLQVGAGAAAVLRLIEEGLFWWVLKVQRNVVCMCLWMNYSGKVRLEPSAVKAWT